MTKKLISLLAVAAAISTVGCARNRELPPEPPSSQAPAEDPFGSQDGSVAGAPVPGSRADFVQTVGQNGDRIFFDLDSYSIDAEDRATLDAQALWLMQNPNVRVTIEGHADERGTREYNVALGDRRANAARDYLQSRGVDSGRMTTISWGKERPAAEGSNEYAWSQNRRAVTVVPE